MENDRFISLKEERRNAKTLEVVVFIIDKSGKVYTIKEKKKNENTGKKNGDYSVICESRAYRESWSQNLMRGITEETGMSEVAMRSAINFDNYRIWEAQFKDGVWATIVVLDCPDSEKFMKAVGKEQDPDGVESVGFISGKDFLKLNLRQGVRNIVDRFSENIVQFKE